MNPLQLALDTGRKIDKVSLRNGEMILNVLDVKDLGEAYELRYRFHQSVLFAYIPKDAVALVTTK